jgi:integrase
MTAPEPIVIKNQDDHTSASPTIGSTSDGAAGANPDFTLDYAQNGGLRGATIISPESHPDTGLEERDNFNLKQVRKHETPENEPDSGTGEDEQEPSFDGIDYPLKAVDILERFKQHPTIRMRPAGTINAYVWRFKRFAKHMKLDDYTRKQIAGPRGKRLIIEHMVDIPLKSRKTTLAGIKKVWIFALDLPWPIDNDRDIGPLPPPGERPTPPDAKVKPWAEKMQGEPSIYLRTLFLVIAESGNRPGTFAKLEWRHVILNEHGLPCEIRADGAKEGLKTFAKIAWRLPANVVDALVELRKWLGDPNDNTSIFPWLDGWCHLERGEKTTRAMITGHFHRLAEKYGLPGLTPIDFRHWVTTQCVDANLREEARAYMEGHKPPGGMRNRYDRRGPEVCMVEQAKAFPHGLLAKFSDVNAEIMPSIPSELIVGLMDYHDGKLKTAEIVDMLETWRLSARQEVQKVELQ